MDRARLVAEREAQAEQVRTLTAEFDTIVESTELVSTDDEHDPDGATIAFERAMIAGLLEGARRGLTEAESALERFDSGSYGVCVSCGELISAERLDVLPAVATCVRCA